jgi:hypothetical protein
MLIITNGVFLSSVKLSLVIPNSVISASQNLFELVQPFETSSSQKLLQQLLLFAFGICFIEVPYLSLVLVSPL